jgi:hypothetical protein
MLLTPIMPIILSQNIVINPPQGATTSDINKTPVTKAKKKERKPKKKSEKKNGKNNLQGPHPSFFSSHLSFCYWSQTVLQTACNHPNSLYSFDPLNI